MGWAHTIISMLVIICMEKTCMEASYNISTDEYALLAIKNHITSDPNDVLLTNWTRGTSVCNWRGVTCGTRHSRVTSLRLISTGLRGTIAREIGNLSFLVFLDIANNSFQGEIPQEIGYLRRLNHLSLQYNQLVGQIPTSLKSLNRLQLLDLSNNNLIGTIPISIFNISSLRIIDLGVNQLQGTLPIDICNNLPTLQAISFSGNQVGGELPSLQKCTQAIYISLSRNMFTGDVSKQIGNFTVLQELYLGWNNLTGRGSFGSVYKATFSNGIVAAIKVFDLDVRDAFKSFDTECEAMRGIRHRNLVKVISSCSNEEFKDIIFEYMPNGSLEDWLYCEDKCLDIGQRLGIMIDVASALEYLHHGYSFPMVHCDLKPNNVLFDEDMIAHLGDFGIAKLLEGDKSMIQTKTLGTMGYMAPEYGSEGIVSTMADVFSFGILMMEICTGKKPTDDKFTGDLSLNVWVSELLLSDQNMMEIIIDAKLLTNTMVDEEKLDIIGSCFKSLITLALECTHDIRENRIDMKNVLARLKKIQIQFQHNIITTTS